MKLVVTAAAGARRGCGCAYVCTS